MNYPKMLYKGEINFNSNEELKNFLNDGSLKTVIVKNDLEEKDFRTNGYKDLQDFKPTKTLTLPKKNDVSLNAS